MRGFGVHHHWLRIEKPAGCSAACKRKGFVIASIDEGKVAHQLLPSRGHFGRGLGGMRGRSWLNGRDQWK